MDVILRILRRYEFSSKKAVQIIIYRPPASNGDRKQIVKPHDCGEQCRGRRRRVFAADSPPIDSRRVSTAALCTQLKACATHCI